MNTTLQEQMTITFKHDSGGVVKFTPAIQGRVWYDSYFDGKLFTHTTLKTEDVADMILHLMEHGYTLHN